MYMASALATSYAPTADVDTPDAMRAALPIAYATATSGGSRLARDWLVEDLPDSAEVKER
jgi:hypothetical protein